MNVLFKTSAGDFTITLNSEKAPATCENFVKYVEDGFFDGTIFHRVINNFMIQGGGFTEDMQQKTTNATVKNEANNGLVNSNGSVAMARTQDPHSATAQFFINVADNDFLNHSAETTQGWGYAVFGEVTDGLDVISQMKTVKTANKAGHQDVPVEALVINTATIVK